jgi:hypothetical protein
MLAYADEVDEHRRIAVRVETVGQAAAREVPLLNPLPGNAFRVAAALPCRVDAKARICVRQSYYSVPGSPAAGCRSHSALTGSTSRHDGVLVARHTRSTAQGAARTWCWTNYLEVLVLHRSPGAVDRGHRPGQRPGNRRVHRGHQRFWDTARPSRTCPAGGRGSMTGRYPRWTGTTNLLQARA